MVLNDKLRWICLVLVAGAAIAASGFEFHFNFTAEGLGTKEVKKEKLPDGKPLIFPVDEFDLAENLKPAIAKFRDQRQKRALPEAKEILGKLSDSSLRVQILVMVREALETDKVSDDFYDRYEAELESVKKILSLWVVYSRDVSTVKLWNQAMRTEIRDPRSRVEKFEAYTFHSKPPHGDQPGSVSLSIQPMVFQKERGMGFVDFGRSIRHDPAMKLDIPITGRPGTSLETLTKDGEKFLEVLGNMLQLYPEKVLLVDLRLYLAESMLRHEIRAKAFHDEMPVELSNALARFALARALEKSAPESGREEVHRKLVLISPATPDLPHLARDLKELKWNQLPPASVSDEVRRAYSYLLMGAMLHGERRETARLLPKEKWKEPARFFARLQELFPDLETGFSAARDWQLAAIEKSPPPAEKNSSSSPPPSNYETSQFDGMTIRHPRSLKSAVAKAGPVLRDGLKKRREQFLQTVSKRPWMEIQSLTDEELDRFKAFGLERPSRKVADNWADLLAKLAEADRLFLTLFTDRIDLWIKEDLQEILQSGGSIDGFALGEDGTVQFTADFGGALNSLSYEEMKKPGAIEAMGTMMLPIVLRQDEIEGKSKEELVKSILEDTTVAALRSDEESMEDLAKKLGMPFRRLTEEFCYLVLIHELGGKRHHRGTHCECGPALVYRRHGHLHRCRNAGQSIGR